MNPTRRSVMCMEANKKPRNKKRRTGNSNNKNKLIADPMIVPADRNGGGKRTLVLPTEKGKLEIDIEKRLARLGWILDDVLRSQLATPALISRHLGRLTPSQIGECFGAPAKRLPVLASTVVAYVCEINRRIKRAARRAKMPAPVFIDSGYGGYRLLRPLADPRGAAGAVIPQPTPPPTLPARAIA
jgi:hypothetical protein